MSLLNAWIAPNEAIVAVDTDGVAENGSHISASKLLTMPHPNVVMGLRGPGTFLQYLQLRCLTANYDSFDARVL